MKLSILSVFFFVVGSLPVSHDIRGDNHSASGEGKSGISGSLALDSQALEIIKERSLAAGSMRLLMKHFHRSLKNGKYLFGNSRSYGFKGIRNDEEMNFPYMDLEQRQSELVHVNNKNEKKDVGDTDDAETVKVSDVKIVYDSSATNDETDNDREEDGSNVTESENDYLTKSILSCCMTRVYGTRRWLRMVIKCPQNWVNETVRGHCESLKDNSEERFMDKIRMLPVQDDQGIVYRNPFCAMCHKVYPIHPWTTSMECKTPDMNSLTLLKTKTPDFSFLQHLNKTANCKHEIIPSFPGELQSCQKNNHIVRQFELARSYQQGVSETKTLPVSFNILLNFDFTGQTHLLFSAEEETVEFHTNKVRKCKEGETYVEYLEMCRAILCDRYYKLVGDTCVPNTEEEMDNNVFNTPYFNEMAFLSLSTNITLGTYLFMRSMENLTEFCVEQIAGQLNISADRLKYVNVSFSFEKANETDVKIYPVDDQTLGKFFHTHRKNLPGLKDENTVNVADQDQMDSSYSRENTNSNVSYNDRGHSTSTKHPEIKNQEPKTSEPDINSDDPRRCFTSPNNDKSLNTKREILKIFAGSTSDISPIEQSSKPTGNSNKRQRLKERNKQGSNFSKSKRYSENESDSGGWNLNRQMTMHISFILVPSDNPQTREQGPASLIAKMSLLITKKKLSIQVSGKEFTLTGMEHSNEDKSGARSTCPWGILMFLDDNEFEWYNRNGTDYLYAKKLNIYFKTGQFDVYAEMHGNNNASKFQVTFMQQIAFVCVMPRINDSDCRRISLASDEYEIDATTRSVAFENKTYDITMYEILNLTTGLIEICVPLSYKYSRDGVSPRIMYLNDTCKKKFEIVIKAESYITEILGRISTVALALVFITYCLFPELRNLPGCNLMNLTLALFIAELVFIESIIVQNSILCTLVIIVLHFFFLVAHFWMNVMSFDVFQTFSKGLISSKERADKGYFWKYFLYAWGMPFLIVSICVFTEFSNLFDVDIGYKIDSKSAGNFSFHSSRSVQNQPNSSFKQGRVINSFPAVTIQKSKTLGLGNVCWIHSPLTAYTAFGLPLLVIFLANCLFFIRTIISVSRTVKLTRDNLNRQESVSSIGKRTVRSEAMLYLRMSSVMGFTWIFGFGSAIVSSVTNAATTAVCIAVRVHSILFVIFNASQGIFIFVSFVCNRRVMQLYFRLYIRIKRCIRKSRKAKVYSISSTVRAIENSNVPAAKTLSYTNK